MRMRYLTPSFSLSVSLSFSLSHLEQHAGFESLFAELGDENEVLGRLVVCAARYLYVMSHM